ncbi:MAG: hypothetical protein WAM71_22525 [Candidatus Korobacteraceae bacterium]
MRRYVELRKIRQKVPLGCKVPADDTHVVAALMQYMFALKQRGYFF